MKTIVLPASGEAARWAGGLVVDDGDLAREIIEHGAVMRLGKKPEDVGRHVRADAVNVEKPGPGFGLSGSCAASISRRHAASER